MVYVLLAEGFEEIEALGFTDILRRAGIDTMLASADNSDTVKGSHGIKVCADVHIDDIDYATADAVVLPGGLPGAYNLRDSERVKKLLDYAFDNGKIMGAICAAPYVYDTFGYLKETHATANPGFADKMTNCIFCSGRVVTDGNFITSQGPGTTHEFAAAFIEKFKSKKLADELIDEMLFGDSLKMRITISQN